MKSKRIAATLELIVNLLAQRRFAELYQLDAAQEMTAADLATCLDEYGGQVSVPLDQQWHYDFYPITGTESVAIDYDLLLDGQPSDLTLQCVVFDEGFEGPYPFTINSIHVL